VVGKALVAVAIQFRDPAGVVSQPNADLANAAPGSSTWTVATRTVQARSGQVLRFLVTDILLAGYRLDAANSVLEFSATVP